MMVSKNGESMWLPKDERKLLLAYFLKIGEPDREGWYEEDVLVKTLKLKKNKKSISMLRDYFKNGLEKESTNQSVSNENDISLSKKEIKDYINYRNIAQTANGRLSKRKLIIIKPHSFKDDVVGISLTIKGWDLAQKYSSWFGTTGEWWKENKGHWVWVLLSIIVSFVIGWLTSKLT